MRAVCVNSRFRRSCACRATLAPDAENTALPAFTREIYREHGRTQARVWAMQDFMRRVGIRDFSTFVRTPHHSPSRHSRDRTLR